VEIGVRVNGVGAAIFASLSTIAEVTRREYYGSDRISLLSTIAEVTRREYDGSALT
jgi:hypothetical protein